MSDPTDEQWLRDLLASAVPDAPPAPDRAGTARARSARAARKRAGTTVVAAVAVVVALSAVVPLAIADHTASAPPAATSSQTASPARIASLPCPRRIGSDHGGDKLPPGAVAMRLCGHLFWTGAPAPHDTLTQGVDTVLATLRGLPVASQCMSHGGPAGLPRYTLLVEYGDGSARRVELDFSACTSVRIGAATYADAEKPYQAYLDALAAQRRTETPPPTPGPAGCKPEYAHKSDIGNPSEMVAADFCVWTHGGHRIVGDPVAPEQLQTILQSWTTSSGRETPKGASCGRRWMLAGVTAWGDPVQIEAEPTLVDGVCDRDPSDGLHDHPLDDAARGVVAQLTDQVLAEARQP